MKKVKLVWWIIAIELFILIFVVAAAEKQSWSYSGSMNHLRQTGYVSTSGFQLLYVDGDDDLTPLELDCLSTLAKEYVITIEYIGDGVNEIIN